MTYQEQVQEVADQTTSQITAALSAYLAGKLTYDTLVAIIAAYLTAGTSAGAAIGSLALSATVSITTGRAVAPIGLTPANNDPERYARAADTILTDLLRANPEKDFRDATENSDHFLRSQEVIDQEQLDHALMRLGRLVEAEIRKTTADIYSEALRLEPEVTGWVRGLEPDACQLCTWWWREGRIWDDNHPMPRHKGCDCSQIPITRKETA